VGGRFLPTSRQRREEMRIEGMVIRAYSEKVNGAPVMGDILLDDGTIQSVPFDRRNWNDFVDDNEVMNFGRTRVVVEGEDVYNCRIRLAEENPSEELRDRMGA
jgi:hypothetical protein